VELVSRELYRSLSEDQRRRFGDPFRSGPDTFREWALQPDPPEGGLSPFLRTLYRVRADLVAAFPDVDGADRDAYCRWARQHGAREMGYSPEFVRGVRPDAVAASSAEGGA
jgi:hypothetical protein